MKKLKIAAAIFLFSGLALTPYFSEAQSGCTICESSMQECHRIIIGNEVHIYYGDAKPCDGDA